MLNKVEIWRSIQISRRLNEIHKCLFSIKYHESPANIDQISPFDCLVSFTGVFGDYLRDTSCAPLLVEACALMDEYEDMIVAAEERADA